MRKKIKNIFKACLKATGVSVILNTVIYFIGTSSEFISTTLPVTSDGQTISLSSVLIMSVVPIFIAVFIFWVISLVAKKADLIFVILSVIILLASFIMPFNVPGISPGMALTLNLMHVVVAGSVIYFILNIESEPNPASKLS